MFRWLGQHSFYFFVTVLIVAVPLQYSVAEPLPEITKQEAKALEKAKKAEAAKLAKEEKQKAKKLAQEERKRLKAEEKAKKKEAARLAKEEKQKAKKLAQEERKRLKAEEKAKKKEAAKLAKESEMVEEVEEEITKPVVGEVVEEVVEKLPEIEEIVKEKVVEKVIEELPVDEEMGDIVVTLPDKIKKQVESEISLEPVEAAVINDESLIAKNLHSPAFGKYNSYFNQVNWLELTATGTEEVVVQVQVYDQDGQKVGESAEVTIPAEGQFHLCIDEFVEQKNNYGIVKIDFDDQNSNATISGQVVVYRQDSGQEHLPLFDRTHSFAFARPLTNGSQGSVYSLANSFDPLGVEEVVSNWLEVCNLDSKEHIFTVRLYSSDGNLVYTTESEVDGNGNSISGIVVPPYGEVDIQAGHEFGQNFYLVEIVPQDLTARFTASVVRYAAKTSVSGYSEDYSFAFSVAAREGTSEMVFSSISNLAEGCWSQSNWLEIANTEDTSVEVSINFRNGSGDIVGDTILNLASYQQEHLNASALIDYGDIGYAEIQVSSGKIIAQSSVYYHDCEENLIQSGYSSSARRPKSGYVAGSYNTVLNTSNKIRVLNTTEYESEITIAAPDENSSESVTSFIPAFSTIEINLGNEPQLGVSNDGYGTVTVFGTDDFLAQELRIKQNGDRIDFAFPVPLK